MIRLITVLQFFTIDNCIDSLYAHTFQRYVPECRECSPGHWRMYILPNAPDLNWIEAVDVGRANGTIEPQVTGSLSTKKTIECKTKEEVVTPEMSSQPSAPAYMNRPTCFGLQRSLGSIEKSTGSSWICQWALPTRRFMLVETLTPHSSWYINAWDLIPAVAKRAVTLSDMADMKNGKR